MSFDLNDVGIQRVSGLNVNFTGPNDLQVVNYTFNLGTLITTEGTLTGDDQNNDGYIQRGETVDHDNPGLLHWRDPLDTIPDLNNAQVIGVGLMGGFVSGIFVQYPVILVDQPGPGGGRFLLYPQGVPGIFTTVGGLINTTITFYPNGQIGPGGEFQPCFTRGTMILTDRGEVAIEDLAEGDLVQTVDNGLQPIRWIGGSVLTAADLGANPNLRPIRIAKGALGEGVPVRDLVVSPQHRVLVRSNIAQRLFGTREVLVAAKQLCQLEGIDVVSDLQEVEYFHILFDRHEVIISEGAETEALFTGDEALRGVEKTALEEILTIFPQLRDPSYSPQPARALVSGRMGRKLAVRHAQNDKHLVQ